jgi:hypothetical protein
MVVALGQFNQGGVHFSVTWDKTGWVWLNTLKVMFIFSHHIGFFLSLGFPQVDPHFRHEDHINDLMDIGDKEYCCQKGTIFEWSKERVQQLKIFWSLTFQLMAIFTSPLVQAPGASKIRGWRDRNFFLFCVGIFRGLSLD